MSGPDGNSVKVHGYVGMYIHVIHHIISYAWIQLHKSYTSYKDIQNHADLGPQHPVMETVTVHRCTFNHPFLQRQVDALLVITSGEMTRGTCASYNT